MYAVIDVETTGLSARTEKITEIAIYIHDGRRWWMSLFRW
ncbi:MAG: exonuclease domain-containing protein [Bacteroidota bacterium]|nr:exonuclease domain-containing protein [Bacteroidota bacterium]